MIQFFVLLGLLTWFLFTMFNDDKKVKICKSNQKLLEEHRAKKAAEQSKEPKPSVEVRQEPETTQEKYERHQREYRERRERKIAEIAVRSDRARLEARPSASPRPIRHYRYSRVTHCFRCASGITSEANNECGSCGWLICNRCGSCSPGCSGGTPKRATRQCEAEPNPMDSEPDNTDEMYPQNYFDEPERWHGDDELRDELNSSTYYHYYHNPDHD